MKQYYVYIVTNRSKTLYTGVTNNLQRCIYEHKHHLVAGFTSKYHLTRLVYFEATSLQTKAGEQKEGGNHAHSALQGYLAHHS